MKNSIKKFIIGFAAGAACMLTTTAIAANYPEISALLFNDVIFNIDDELVASPSDQPVLNYNDRVYVPIRFVAEKLGCDVTWDIANRQVVIEGATKEVQTEIVEVEKEVIVYVDKDEIGEGDVVYESLPLRYKTNEFNLEINGISRRTLDNVTEIYVYLENLTSQDQVFLDFQDAEFIVDGEEIAVPRDSDYWDMEWYNPLYSEDDKDGFLSFELIDEDYKYCDLTVPVRIYRADGSEKTVEATFHFMNNDNSSKSED